MRNIFRYILLGLSIAAFAGCTEKEAGVEFGIDTNEITAGPDGGVFNVNVSSGNNWVASTEAAWITISPANGSANQLCQIQIDSAVMVSAVEAVRTANIYVQDQTTFEDKVITVTQDNYGYSILSDKTTIEIPNYGDYGTRNIDLEVKANTDFIIRVTYKDANGNVIDSETAGQWIKFNDSSVESPVYEFNGNRGARPRNIPVRLNWDVNSDTSFDETTIPQARNADVEFVPVNEAGEASGVECDVNTVAVTQEAAVKIMPDSRAGDSTALVSIARSLGVWEAWDVSQPMSTWSDVRLWEEGDEGYTAENRGRVKYARFYMCGTEETDCIPFEVKYLTAAEELVFFSNQNKERLNLSTGPYISDLTQLKRLSIVYFGLSQLDPSITRLTNLEYLNLAGNNFQTIPEEVFAFKNNANFHALLLNTNYRNLVYDLSNATNLKNLGGFYDETESGLRELFLWENLDTLTLGVNYFRGSLPTFLGENGQAEAGVKTYEQYLTENPDAADSLSVFNGKNMPVVLPKIKYLTLNLNRLTGEIPLWLLYHPSLDWLDPFTLVFNQEGSLPREEDGAVVEAGFSNIPIDYDYEGVEGAIYGGYYEFFTDKKLSPDSNQ